MRGGVELALRLPWNRKAIHDLDRIAGNLEMRIMSNIFAAAS